MRRLVASFLISLDGVVEDPDRWHCRYRDREVAAAMRASMAGADTLLMGRVLYEQWAGAWPCHLGEPRHRYVVSTTLSEVPGEDTTLLREDVVAEVAALKTRPGRDVAVVGSATLTQTLLAHGLVDLLQLLVHPVVVGRGRRLFPEGMEPQDLRLRRSQAFRTGVLFLQYEPGEPCVPPGPWRSRRRAS